MNYIAYKNVEETSDTLKIDNELIDEGLDYIYQLVNLWFCDRGFSDASLLTDIDVILIKVYNNEITHCELEDDTFNKSKIIIDANPLDNYVTITHNYKKCVGLLYKCA